MKMAEIIKFKPDQASATHHRNATQKALLKRGLRLLGRACLACLLLPLRWLRGLFILIGALLFPAIAPAGLFFLLWTAIFTFTEIHDGWKEAWTVEVTGGLVVASIVLWFICERARVLLDEATFNRHMRYLNKKK